MSDTFQHPIETVETIRRVWIEAMPWHLADYGTELGDWRAEYAGLPQPFLDALGALADRPDEVTCAMCTKAGVGFVLREDDDRPHAGGLDWADTWLVQFGETGRVWAVCLDCSGPEESTMRHNVGVMTAS